MEPTSIRSAAISGRAFESSRRPARPGRPAAASNQNCRFISVRDRLMDYRRMAWAAAVVTLTLTARPATAQVVYELANASGVAQATFTVAQGQKVPVEVFLHDQGAGAP